MAQHTIREGEIFIFDFLCFVGLLRQLKNTDRGNVVEYKTEIIVEQLKQEKPSASPSAVVSQVFCPPSL